MDEPKCTNSRFRRAKSVNSAEDIRQYEERVRKLQPDRPCHKYQDSLFSWSPSSQNYGGFVNWAFLLLSMGGLRLLLENILKYGIRIDPKQWLVIALGVNESERYMSFIMFLYTIVPITVCLFVEKGLSEGKLNEKLGLCLQILNAALVVLLPMAVITRFSTHITLIGASMVCFIYCAIFLKLWSYVQVNRWCRKSVSDMKAKKKRIRQCSSFTSVIKNMEDKCANSSAAVDLHLTSYPDNLCMKDILYFMCIPTLCYELNFPRTDRIRKRFLLKWMLELIIGIHIMAGLFQQWMIPSVKHALIPFSNMDVMNATERLLKLSIPNHLMWLIMFYLIFHSYLNFIGEICRFADRAFYLDWWNANNSSEFWRKWNIPVHKWAVRHVYLPMVDIGYSKVMAIGMVFFISAFFHEFLVSVPLRTFKSWAFIGMMMQIPLAHFSSWAEERYGPRWGNIIVWLSLILGQPLCVMMYYHDYVIAHFGQSLIQQFGDI